MRHWEESHKRRGNKVLQDSDEDDRVDPTIFSYSDNKFLKYYQDKLGVTNESLNPFVSYTYTDDDYEKMIIKTKMKSLKLESISTSNKKIIRK